MPAADDPTTADTADLLALARHEHDAVRRQTQPDASFLYGTWAATWALGMGLMWASWDDGTPAPWSRGVFAVMIVAAIAATAVHIQRRVQGVHGRSADAGRRWGIAWAVAFATYGLLMGALDRADAPTDTVQLLSPVLPCFIVGVLYMSGGALWHDRLQFAIGVWITVVAGIAAIAGTPHHLLVLAALGGGGLTVGAVVSARVERGR
jgi:hypothetical protein